LSVGLLLHGLLAAIAVVAEDQAARVLLCGICTLGGRAYAVLMLCKTCGPDDQTETREPKLMSKGLRKTIMCHRLACGHAWHRTAVIGSPALVAACNCRSPTVDADAQAAAVMLAAAGFYDNKNAGCWVHREQGRVISKPTVAAHDTDWLARWITSSMAAADDCDRLLGKAGFTYDKGLNVWFNLVAGRAISGETVRRNTAEWIAGWIAAWRAAT
jgi:hypothetical protein